MATMQVPNKQDISTMKKKGSFFCEKLPYLAMGPISHRGSKGNIRINGTEETQHQPVYQHTTKKSNSSPNIDPGGRFQVNHWTNRDQSTKILSNKRRMSASSVSIPKRTNQSNDPKPGPYGTKSSKVDRRRSSLRTQPLYPGSYFLSILSDPMEESVSSDGLSDSDYSSNALLTEYWQDVKLLDRKQTLAASCDHQLDYDGEQPLFTGSNLKYYTPLVPETLDDLPEKGLREKDEKRKTAPDIFNGVIQEKDKATRHWKMLAPPTKGSNSGEESSKSSIPSILSRLSWNGETSESNSSSSRRQSLSQRSNSLIDRVLPEKRASFRNTRKFIYSLARIAGKSGQGSATSLEDVPRRGFGALTARGAGVRLMLRREQQMGGPRMAALGALIAARKRFSLKDHLVVRFDPKIPWRKLILWVRIRSMLKRMHEQIKDKVTHDPSSPLYMIQLSEEDSIGIDRDHYMFFDPSDFKANRQMRTSQEVKRILTLPSEQRAAEEVHCAMIGLRAINTIAEYPVRMQRHLAEHGVFQSFNAKRAIVRQGCPPEGFYYILYGRVLVAVRDEVTGKVEIKCYLHRGHAFGELAIIRHTNRQSTVITKNYTELLFLPSEIFEKYFMVGGVKNLNDPDQVHFIRSLSFLRGWPMELVLNVNDEHNISFGYFKRGSILSRDSNISDWLIIVKSGSLSVLKKLVKAKPTASKKTGLLHFESEDSLLTFLDNGRDSIMRSVEPEGAVTPFILNYDEQDDVSDDDELSPVCFANRPHTSVCNYRSVTRMSSGFRSSLGKVKNTSSIPDFKADNLLLRRHTSQALTSSRTKAQRNRAVSRELSPDDALELDDKRTFLDDLDSSYYSRSHAVTEADVNPQFVYVQTLTKGDVFGLAQCLFCDQPSLCVVSNGADCILMSKKLFLDNCSPEHIRRLRVEVSPYPSEDKLQEDLITRINWDVYKGALRKQIYTQQRDKLRLP